MVGVCIVEGGHRLYEQRWAQTRREERRNLRWLSDVVREHVGLPVVTWSGSTADIPILGKAAARLNMDLGEVVTRHVDLYAHWALGNVRLPCSGFRLTTVAGRFKHRGRSKISGGFEAVTLYRRALATGDQTLRERLHEYNRDDLDALITVVEGLRQVVAAHKTTMTSSR